MGLNDPENAPLDSDVTIPWTDRRKRAVRCLFRADGEITVSTLVQCVLSGDERVQSPADRAAYRRARRQLLEVDLPVLEAYGIVEWRGSERIALRSPYTDAAGSDGWRDAVLNPRPWQYAAIALLGGVTAALAWANVLPFAVLPVVVYAVLTSVISLVLSFLQFAARRRRALDLYL